MNDGKDLFRFEDVRLAREGRVILDIDRATLVGGGITAIVGASGSGKTTLLRLCNRLSVPDSGRVFYRDDDVAEMSATVLRRAVGMVFQKPTPFGGTVRDNLRVAAPKRADSEYADNLVRVGLDPTWLDRQAADLSGGEAQRLCMARTLATEPKVVLCDEPTAHLDAGATEAIEALVLSLAETGTDIVWVTHDPRQVDRIANHMFRIEASSLVGGSLPHRQEAQRDA